MSSGDQILEEKKSSRQTLEDWLKSGGQVEKVPSKVPPNYVQHLKSKFKRSTRGKMK